VIIVGIVAINRLVMIMAIMMIAVIVAAIAAILIIGDGASDSNRNHKSCCSACNCKKGFMEPDFFFLS